MGATDSDVLSPTPPVECLSTTLRPSRAAEIDRLAATDHRVGEHVRLALGEAAEEHGHAEGGHLVVRHLTARVAEDQLGELVVGQLLPVALALDQLGRPDHVVATKMVLRPWTTNGSSTSAGTSPVGTDTESRYATSFSRVRTIARASQS